MNTHILYTQDLKATEEHIEQLLGHITVICTPNVIIVNLPDEVLINTLKGNVTDKIPDNADELSKLCMKSWQPLDLDKLDTPILPVDKNHYAKNRFTSNELREQHSNYPPTTSSYLVGKVFVSLFLVSGDIPKLTLSEDERTNVIQQVTYTFHAIASLEPLVKITFRTKIHTATVVAKPLKSCLDKDICERIWRDPVLKKLGYSIGLQGVRELNEAMIDEHDAKFSFTAFFTKYPLEHFAYAGSGRICMNYENNGYGPKNIFRIFAHELCHIFGAGDEYASSPTCNCSERGFFEVPNYNCANCNSSPYPHVTCLMNDSFSITKLCTWSRGQLGWPFFFTIPNSTNECGMITFKDELILSYPEEYDDQKKYNYIIRSSEMGIKWKNQGSLDIFTKNYNKLSFAIWKGYLCAAFQNDNNELYIAYSKSYWSTGWETLHIKEQKTYGSPSMIVVEDNIYIAYKGSGQQLYITTTDNIKSWPTKAYKIAKQKTSANPSLAFFKNQFFIAYKEAEAWSYKLLITSTYDITVWPKSSINVSAQKTQSGPSIINYKNKKLLIAYRGYGSNRIMITESIDGKKWPIHGFHLTGQNTSGSPTLCMFDDEPWIGYQYDKKLYIGCLRNMYFL